MDISIIVATYNRCKSLEDTLRALQGQKTASGIISEMIIVDNNSSDETRKLVEQYRQQFPGKFKYLFEPRQGLSYARNMGINEAQGEIIAFTDDDCQPEADWLERIVKKFQEEPELDGVLGAPIMTDGSHMYNKNNDLLRGNGLNMAFRREMFKKYGNFDSYLGAGSIGCAAEDTEFVYRLLRAKRKVAIDEGIRIIHKHKPNAGEKLKFANRDANGYVVFWLKYVLKARDMFACKRIAWFFYYDIKGFIVALLKGQPDRIKLKFTQFKGGVAGLLKGLYIWLLLNRGSN
ncbi:MAG: glycosyltransferase family A protein [bacterium]|nr:glycosyltransferase family A protein [bacterium]MDD5757167.1 glycosyltransferase family A protein [bacterium]